MKKMLTLPALALVIFGCGGCTAKAHRNSIKESSVNGAKIYEFSMKDIDGKNKNLSDYKGKVLLVVNVASKCGKTPQYKGLEAFYKKHQAAGFEILGFPANNFGSQEPGTEAEIKEFCMTNYGVTFPMFSKISVKGSDMHPLYQYLTEETAFKGEIGWNFAKFLVDREGRVVGRFDSDTAVESSNLSGAILAALK